jgi:lactobin A/cerein 7B family class IIb bacteriocin
MIVTLEDNQPITVTDAELASANGGVLPLVIAGGVVAAGAAWAYYGGGINAGISIGNNNRQAVGNQAPVALGDNSGVSRSGQ